MRILVTGASGFVGKPLCISLQAANYSVRGAVRRRNVFSPKGIETVIVGEIGESTDWTSALEDVNVVVHLAARVQEVKKKTAEALAEFREVNVIGTLNIARQAALVGVERFVFLSSIKVNGENTHRFSSCAGTISSPEAFLETDKSSPQDPYSISKLEAEQGLFEIAEKTGMEIVIIRPPLVYGPGVKGNFAAMINCVRKGIPLPLGAVNNLRSLLALDNLIDFITLCADRNKSPQAANQIFLISDNEDISTSNLLGKIADAYGKQVRLLRIPPTWLRWAAYLLGKEAVSSRLLDSLIIDSSKAHDLLGWHPIVSMDEQLQKMARNAESI